MQTAPTTESFATVVFPGQGCQRHKMALDFVASFPEAAEVFAVAKDSLPFDPTALCNIDDGQLDLTEYTQPCVLTAEMAMFRALQSRAGFAPRYFGGHSLGEYTALVACGAIPLHVALKLVHVRGRLMQAAVPADQSAMVALITQEPLPSNEILGLAREHRVDIANDNSPLQMVVSGMKLDVDGVHAALSQRYPTMRLVPLAVSAPFHSRHMKVIQDRFRAELQSAADTFHPAHATRVTSNSTGTFHTGSLADLIDSLTSQISSPVRWRDNMNHLLSAAPGEAILELGPGRPLGLFFKAIGTTVPAVIDIRSARRAFPHLERATLS